MNILIGVSLILILIKDTNNYFEYAERANINVSELTFFVLIKENFFRIFQSVVFIISGIILLKKIKIGFIVSLVSWIVFIFDLFKILLSVLIVIKFEKIELIIIVFLIFLFLTIFLSHLNKYKWNKNDWFKTAGIAILLITIRLFS